MIEFYYNDQPYNPSNKQGWHVIDFKINLDEDNISKMWNAKRYSRIINWKIKQLDMIKCNIRKKTSEK